RLLPLKSGKTYLAHIKKKYRQTVCTSLVLLALTFVYVVPCGRFSTGWFRNISPVTSFTVSSTPSRNFPCESSPRSIRASSVSHPEVREASATFIPRTVSYRKSPLGVGTTYLPE